MDGTWFVLAPGPSLTQGLVDKVKGRKVCAVCNAYELAPWADMLVANDRVWWREHPAAHQFAGRKLSGNRIDGVELVTPSTFGIPSNSGVLALDALRNEGATKIVMIGFDSHGSHFFGAYKNRCRNTPERRRQEHRLQFQGWAAGNKSVKVLNCTEGSKITAFPFASLEHHLG